MKITVTYLAFKINIKESVETRVTLLKTSWKKNWT